MVMQLVNKLVPFRWGGHPDEVAKLAMSDRMRIDVSCLKISIKRARLIKVPIFAAIRDLTFSNRQVESGYSHLMSIGNDNGLNPHLCHISN
jgi:hypothetical protein